MPNRVVTRTGIVIGCLHQRAAPRPGSEAERIQAALLAPARVSLRRRLHNLLVLVTGQSDELATLQD